MPCRDYEDDYDRSRCITLEQEIARLSERNDELAAKLCTTRQIVKELHESLCRSNQWSLVTYIEEALARAEYSIEDLSYDTIVHRVHDTEEEYRKASSAFDAHFSKMGKISSLGGVIPDHMLKELKDLKDAKTKAGLIAAAAKREYLTHERTIAMGGNK